MLRAGLDLSRRKIEICLLSDQESILTNSPRRLSPRGPLPARPGAGDLAP
jgi:hypothetical protein